ARGRARRPVAEADLQCGGERDRGAHGAHTRPHCRAAHARPGLGGHGRGPRRCRRPGHRARQEPRGAVRLRGAGRGRVRPQASHASGRRGRARDRDRLPERRHRRLRRAPRRRRTAQPRADRARQGTGEERLMAETSQTEIDRRLNAVREAAQSNDVDAVVVSGSEYTGFEGAVRYVSGFRILHRYAYVVVPVEGNPAIVYPREARWVGDHAETWIDEQVFAEHPGQWIAEQARERNWERIGVSGLDYVMAVRDYRALADGQAVIVPFAAPFGPAPPGQSR